jgi:hypothetical protein
MSGQLRVAARPHIPTAIARSSHPTGRILLSARRKRLRAGHAAARKFESEDQMDRPATIGEVTGRFGWSITADRPGDR